MGRTVKRLKTRSRSALGLIKKYLCFLTVALTLLSNVGFASTTPTYISKKNYLKMLATKLDRWSLGLLQTAYSFSLIKEEDDILIRIVNISSTAVIDELNEQKKAVDNRIVSNCKKELVAQIKSPGSRYPLKEIETLRAKIRIIKRSATTYVETEVVAGEVASVTSTATRQEGLIATLLKTKWGRKFLSQLGLAKKITLWFTVGYTLFSNGKALASCSDSTSTCLHGVLGENLLEEGEDFLPNLLTANLIEDCHWGIMGEGLADRNILSLMESSTSFLFAVEAAIKKGCAIPRAKNLYNQYVAKKVSVEPNMSRIHSIISALDEKTTRFELDSKLGALKWYKANAPAAYVWMISDVTTVGWMNKVPELTSAITNACHFSSEGIARNITCGYLERYNRQSSDRR